MKGNSLGLIIALASISSALAAVPSSGPPIQGHLDPKTGMFYPQSMPRPDSTPITTGGTFVVKATVRLDAAITKDDTISAQLTISARDPDAAAGAQYDDMSEISGVMTRSGQTATITLTLPYYWRLTSTKDQVDLTFNASDFSGTEPSATFFETIALPANNKVTDVVIGDAM